jgi:hypothetical protein
MSQQNEPARGKDPCEEFAELLVDSLELPMAPELVAHLEVCQHCRAERESVERAWRELAVLAEAEPSAALQRRFDAWLLAQTGAVAARRQRRERWRSWLLPSAGLRWAWVAAIAALAVGLFVGTRWGAPSASTEIATLRDEVRTLNRLVTLSLLAQPDASDRLQGVSYGRSDSRDARIVDALIQIVREDENVNVRLAAVDALAVAASDAETRERLVATFAGQQAPLVQIALADVLLASDGAAARKSLAAVLEASDRHPLDATVRDYLKKRLSESA